jgi:muconolactone delta-isomerase
MKLKLDITPDLVAAMAAEVKAGEKAVTAAMREAGTGLKTAWRGQITGAGSAGGWRTRSGARPIRRPARA